MLMPFTKILDKYRRESFSEANKGTRFEEPIREFFGQTPSTGFTSRIFGSGAIFFF